MARSLALGLLLLALPGCLAGCWSRREVEDIALVTTIGIDREGDLYRLSLEIAKPAEIRGPGPMGGAGAAAGGEPGLVVSAMGHTISEAARALERQVPREIFYASSRLILLGEEAARAGLLPLDMLHRDRRVRLSNWVMVTRGEARDILALPPDLELSNGIRLGRLTRLQTGLAVELKELLDMLTTPGVNPVVSLVEPRTEEELSGGGQKGNRRSRAPSLQGAAVFRGDRLAGFLDAAETRGLLWMRGEMERGLVSFPLPEQGSYLSFRFWRGETKIVPRVEEGRISFRVLLRAEADLAEETGAPGPDLERPGVFEEMERLLAEDVEERCRGTLRKLQEEFGSDAVGFGEALHRAYPQVWHQVRDNWNEYFATAPVSIEAHVHVRRVGMARGPLKRD